MPKHNVKRQIRGGPELRARDDDQRYSEGRGHARDFYRGAVMMQSYCVLMESVLNVVKQTTPLHLVGSVVAVYLTRSRRGRARRGGGRARLRALRSTAAGGVVARRADPPYSAEILVLICEWVFEKMKSVLSSNGVLMHLDPSDHDYLTIVCGRRRAYATLSGRGGRAPPKGKMRKFIKKIGVSEVLANGLQGYEIFLPASNSLKLNKAQSTENKADYLSASGATRRGDASGGGGEGCGGGRLAAYVNFILAGELRVMLDSLKKESSSYGVLKKVIS
ncbi:hypothetical protein EVAR_90750_1 [Eumeta japonica]|uniref:Uncharacterized protein n=1 Tax=Eumeta variegata TaxID=151549 RepID=A0A4C1ZEV3_EUMVA|nr:hypothetical protein EVAR_90750_1 [Eumeta japonica]